MATSISDLRLRPVLPNKALPDTGCLLLQSIDLSYGASHTQRLWRSLLLSSFPWLSGMLNDFPRRTYFNIHSPTIVCAIASTTPVECDAVVSVVGTVLLVLSVLSVLADSSC